ncbi:type III secretion system chaperone [Aquibium sp. ELW1220]|uniref:type III secretion system chaperone n=1 Tax=Aquibium sp. ELW1220 TaxID=2976766 RepID=UPI0025B0B620|nr:type III secretion system chaperone [Aquibium sp. ELW1220]MDN2582502.1 type III secretion system chaperone [Aquibium sp. ELW1220]
MDAGQTIRTLATKLGLNDTAFDADGRLTIELGRGAVIHAARLDDHTVEWSVPLPDVDFADPAMMRVMLEANCLGAGTGAGRLAVDGDLAAYFCERWVVRGMDEKETERRFDEMAAVAAYWLGDGADLLMERAQASRHNGRDHVPPPADEDMLVMRA